MQDDETASFVSRREWSLVERFVDDGISGSHDRRPGLQSMLQAARQRRFDVLVVYRSDRLFRSLQELVNTLAELGELGVGFASVNEPFDTTTSAGRLLLQMVGAFAEFERNVMIERTRSGLAAARRRGVTLGRPKRFVDVERAKALRARGWSVSAIAIELKTSPATLYRALSNFPILELRDVDELAGGAGEQPLSDEPV